MGRMGEARNGERLEREGVWNAKVFGTRRCLEREGVWNAKTRSNAKGAKREDAKGSRRGAGLRALVVFAPSRSSCFVIFVIFVASRSKPLPHGA
jgi:hypothetical protein